MHYGYCDTYQPHAVRRILDNAEGTLYDMRWDGAGNLGQVSMARGNQFESGRFLFWTEDGRLHTAVDDNYHSYYAYDHGGERRLKLTGHNGLLDVNADLMATFAMLKTPTLYPSSYMVLTVKGYTKHYYAGMERVAARLGGGGLNALCQLIDGNDALQTKADVLFDQGLEQANSRVLNEGDPGCIQNDMLGMEEFVEPIYSIPSQMQAGADFDYNRFREKLETILDDPNNGQENSVYFYHSDHLGSASWITDGDGQAIQHLQYLPYGERFVDQRMSGYSERFTFTGKERDEETGFGYFGARYMDHELMTMWLSVDPLADKYPSISPYAYCAWNPVKLVDPDGMELWKPEVYKNGDVMYKKEEGDNASTLQKQYGLSTKVAQQLYRTMKNGRISGKSVSRLASEGQILKVDWNNATDYQKIYQAFFAILHGIATGRGAQADMNNYFVNVPSHKIKKAMFMGVTNNCIVVTGDIALPLFDGKEVCAKYASLSINAEGNMAKVGYPQPPKQVGDRANPDYVHTYPQLGGNMPRLLVRLASDYGEMYLRDYY